MIREWRTLWVQRSTIGSVDWLRPGWQNLVAKIIEIQLFGLTDRLRLVNVNDEWPVPWNIMHHDWGRRKPILEGKLEFQDRQSRQDCKHLPKVRQAPSCLCEVLVMDLGEVTPGVCVRVVNDGLHRSVYSKRDWSDLYICSNSLSSKYSRIAGGYCPAPIQSPQIPVNNFVMINPVAIDENKTLGLLAW